jgi:hypothetical protein
MLLFSTSGIFGSTQWQTSSWAASPRASYWLHTKVERVIYENGLDWDTSIDEVAYTRCSGEGRFVRGKAGVRLYTTFRCYVEPRQDDASISAADPFWITFRVLSPNKWSYAVRSDPADAGSPRNSYWSRAEVERVIYENGLEWNTGVDEVAHTECSGEGRFMLSKARARLYRTFRCYVEPLPGEAYVFSPDPYWIIFHVLGPDDWDYALLDYEG